MTDLEAFIAAYMDACKDRPADWNEIGYWYARKLWDAALKHQDAKIDEWMKAAQQRGYERGVKDERERCAADRKSHADAASLFHRTLCMGDGCKECERVAAALQAHTKSPASPVKSPATR